MQLFAQKGKKQHQASKDCWATQFNLANNKNGNPDTTFSKTFDVII